MNFADSEVVASILKKEGYELTDDSKKANLVLLNTCSIRDKAEQTVRKKLKTFNSQKKENKNLKIGLLGCMAERLKEKLLEEEKIVDLVVGPDSYKDLPNLLDKVDHNQRAVNVILSKSETYGDISPVRIHNNGTNAFVSITRGCDNMCTFCVVPFTRGRERSRNPESILREINELNEKGYKEITLLGQSVNAYGRDFAYKIKDSKEIDPDERVDFSWLLTQIDNQFPDLRIRFTSPHPQLFTDRLINTIADLPTVCEHIHLPLQSADDEVLHSMRRNYSFEKFQNIVSKLRKAIPDMGVSTDIIVGFPGETEEKFRKSLHAMTELKFDQAFMFAYSPRRHTEAFDFKGEISGDIQNRRLQELIESANKSFNRINKQLIGTTFEVLVEGPSAKNPARMSGRTRSNKTMIFDAPKSTIGTLIKVRATESFLWGFKGEATKPHSVRAQTVSEKLRIIS